MDSPSSDPSSDMYVQILMKKIYICMYKNVQILMKKIYLMNVEMYIIICILVYPGGAKPPSLGPGIVRDIIHFV